MKNKKRLNQTILKRLRALWNSATPQERAYGMDWYRLAGSISTQLGQDWGITTSQAAGVIAALSPGNNWERNLQDADTALESWSKGEDIPKSVGTYGQANRDKVLRILSGEPPLEVLGGDKVTAFYRNILGVEDGAVTIDRHAKGAALGIRGDPETAIKGSKEYQELSAHYRKVAQEVGVRPMDLQAVIWVVWRDGGRA